MNMLKRYGQKIPILLLGVLLAVFLGGCLCPGILSPTSPLASLEPEFVSHLSTKLGGRVVFHRKGNSGTFNIYTLDLETGSVTQLTSEPGNNFDPAFSPDGTRIAFISDRDLRPPYGSLWLMNADGTDQHILLEGGDFFEIGPTWSPDGTHIAFQSNRQGNPDIFILNLDTAELKNLTNHPNVDANPAWAPDGQKIAFVSDRSGNPEIWCINADGTGLRQITSSSMMGEWRPTWSPDGTRLAFEAFPSIAPRQIYIQSLDEAEAHIVDNFSIWNTWPTWVSQDLIIYAAVEEYDEDAPKENEANLYLQNIKTGEIERLTTGPEDDGHPSWSH